MQRAMKEIWTIDILLRNGMWAPSEVFKDLTLEDAVDLCGKLKHPDRFRIRNSLTDEIIPCTAL